VQLFAVFWQLAQDVLQVVQMWVVISGYVPVGHKDPEIQLVPFKKDS
jgi:hypothetical protein